MRVCLATKEFPPFTVHTGGIGRRYAALAPELACLGHEVHVIIVGDRRGQELVQDGVALHVLPRLYPQRVWFADDLVSSATIDRALRRLGRFDVVFAPEWTGPASVYAMHKRSGPLITNLATSYVQIKALTEGAPSPQGRIKGIPQPVLERRQAERSDGILACSRAILEWTRRLWDIDHLPTTVVPNFVDVAATRELAASSEPPLGWPSSGPVVVFAGRVEGRKGVHTLVEAMHLVWDERPETQLVVIGRDTYEGGSVTAQMKQAAGSRAGSMHFLGRQPSGPLLAAMARADVFTAPSLWEAFGIVALEAMAVGTPVVVTSGSGYDEFVRAGTDGLAVPPRDARALAAALKRLLGDPDERKRLAASARERSDEFSAAKLAPRYIEHFERVAGGGGGPARRKLDPCRRVSFCYHAVSPDWPSSFSIGPERLEQQVAYLLDRRHRPVTFTDLVHGDYAGRAVAITFDDAHRSVYDVAFPVLQRLGVVATLFVPTRYADDERPLLFEGYAQWVGTKWERELEPMTWEQIGELAAAGWEIGSHTRDHLRLTHVDDETLREELAGSKADVERRTGRPCTALAYPYGDFDHRVRAGTEQAGYTAAAALGSDAPDPLSWPRHLVMLEHGEGHFRRSASPLFRRLRRTPLWPAASSAARLSRGGGTGTQRGG